MVGIFKVTKEKSRVHFLPRANSHFYSQFAIFEGKKFSFLWRGNDTFENLKVKNAETAQYFENGFL